MQKSPNERASNGWQKRRLRINRRHFNRSSSSRFARHFIKTRLINYACFLPLLGTEWRCWFLDQFTNLLDKTTIIYPTVRRIVDCKYADAFNRRARASKKFLLPRLILLPESQRIKHDTRTIALHDHQVTFTLSSHPLAVYPVQRRSAEEEESRSEPAKARKLSSCGNSRVWRKLLNVFPAFFRSLAAAEKFI